MEDETASLPAVSRSQVPPVLEHYDLERPIGAGAMSTVWRATDRRTGGAVAVKIVQLADDELRARFRREATLIDRVEHRGVCRVLDAGADATSGFLVMELLEGRTLAHLLTAHGLGSLRQIVDLLQQIAAAMAVVHDHGMIHRDLKPSNVLVCADRAVVIDFGLAFLPSPFPALIDAGLGRMTVHGTTAGSAAIMAPEQICEAPLSGATDVYGLGCTAYQLVTGRPPFHGPAAVVVGKHLHATPPDLRSLAPAVPAALAALVAQMLAKRPDDRPSMATIAARCAALLDELTDDALAAAPRGPYEVVAAVPFQIATLARVAAIGAISDDTLIALAAAGFHAVRHDGVAPLDADVVVIEGSSAAHGDLPVIALSAATDPGETVARVAEAARSRRG